MPYEFYKLLHYIGIFMTITALGGVFIFAANGGKKESNKFRRLVGITHGVGLVLVLVAGFGMLARLQLGGFPTWVALKVGIWLLLGGLLPVVYKRPETARPLWTLLIAISAIAAYFAIYKPF